MNAPRPFVAAINAVLLAGFAGGALATVDTAGLVYTPITPCRIVDTRVTGGPFAAKEARTFQTNGAATQGGGACTVYSSTIPAALSLNVTVDATSLGSPAQYGFLNVTPTPGPGTSWMNFFGGQTVANAGVATINQLDGTFAIKTQNPANVIVDVFGNFSQGPAAASNATSFQYATLSTSVSNVASFTFTPPASGKVIAHVGGYCNFPINANVASSYGLGLTDVSLQDPTSGLIPVSSIAVVTLELPMSQNIQSSYSADRMFSVSASQQTIYVTGVVQYGDVTPTCNGTLTIMYTSNAL